MPRRKSKEGGFVDNDDLVQGLILGDSYMMNRFRPLTLEEPKVLLPVGGCPMINYSLELLSNVCNEIFVVCTSHHDKLNEYIKYSKWNNKKYYPNLTIKAIIAPYCSNIGSVFNYINKTYNNLIHSNPFIVIRGDIITNIDLKDFVMKHKKRYKSDNNNVLTCVFKKVDPKQRTTYVNIYLVFLR